MDIPGLKYLSQLGKVKSSVCSSLFINNNLVNDSLQITNFLIENIAEAFENKEHVLDIFLDLSKAFNIVDHKILQSKLWHCGIRCVAHGWFCSYLSNRKQLVEINNFNVISKCFIFV